MTIGESIKSCRLREGMTIRALARMTSVSPTHICDIEWGRRMPSVALLHRISRALECPMEDLAGYDFRPTSEQLVRLGTMDYQWSLALAFLMDRIQGGLTPKGLVDLLGQDDG